MYIKYPVVYMDYNGPFFCLVSFSSLIIQEFVTYDPPILFIAAIQSITLIHRFTSVLFFDVCLSSLHPVYLYPNINNVMQCKLFDVTKKLWN